MWKELYLGWLRDELLSSKFIFQWLNLYHLKGNPILKTDEDAMFDVLIWGLSANKFCISECFTPWYRLLNNHTAYKQTPSSVKLMCHKDKQ